jgi:hypothetical protein
VFFVSAKEAVQLAEPHLGTNVSGNFFGNPFAITTHALRIYYTCF